MLNIWYIIRLPLLFPGYNVERKVKGTSCIYSTQYYYLHNIEYSKAASNEKNAIASFIDWY